MICLNTNCHASATCFNCKHSDADELDQARATNASDTLDDWACVGGRAYRVRQRHDGGAELILIVNGNKTEKRFSSAGQGRAGKRAVRVAAAAWIDAGAPSAAETINAELDRANLGQGK